MKIYRIQALCSGLIVLLCLSVSCVRDEYDLKKNTDNTMSIGGDNLGFPLGSTARFTVESLLKGNTLGEVLVKDGSGNYVLRPGSQRFGMDIDAVDIDAFIIDDIVVVDDVPMESQGQQPSSKAEVEAPVYTIEHEINLDFVYHNIPQVVKSLSRMDFQGTYLDLLFEFPELPQGIDIADLEPNLEIIIPNEFFTSEDIPSSSSGGVIRITGFNTDRGFKTRLSLDGVDLSLFELSNQNLEFDPVVVFRGTVTVKAPAQKNTGGTIPDFNALSFTPQITCAVRDIHPERINGVFRCQSPDYEQTIAFGSVPPAFRAEGTNLDFYNPNLLLSIRTNVTLPFVAGMTVTPVVDGVEVEQDRQVISLNIPAAQAGGSEFRFWMGEDKSLMPEGCEYVMADIAALVKHLPEELRVMVKGATDTLQPQSYVFGQDFTTEVELGAQVPLMFEEGFKIAFSDTLAFSDQQVARQLVGRKIEVAGEVTNSFPLDFIIEVKALDENMNTLLTSSTQKVGGSGNGKEVVSPLSLFMDDANSDLADKTVAAFVISVSAVVDEGQGRVSVNASNFIQARASLKLPGGIRVDPGTLL